MQPKQQQFSLWYFAAMLLVLMTLQATLFAPHAENLAYSDFKALAKAGKVEDVAVGQRVITGRLASEGLEGLLPPKTLEALRKAGGGDAPGNVVCRA